MLISLRIWLWLYIDVVILIGYASQAERQASEFLTYPMAKLAGNTFLFVGQTRAHPSVIQNQYTLYAHFRWALKPAALTTKTTVIQGKNTVRIEFRTSAKYKFEFTFDPST